MSPAANAGLRHRLRRKLAAEIETARDLGDWQEAERLTAEFWDAEEARAARDIAAELAKLPLSARMSV
jgi:hypothetical protein